MGRKSAHDHITREMLEGLLDSGETSFRLACKLDMPPSSFRALVRKHGLKIDRKKKPVEPDDPFKKPIPTGLIAITPDVERYLRRHYGKMKRTEMARQLGIGKYDLNRMIMQMGLGDV